MAVCATIGIALGIVAITRLTDARTLVVSKNGPALTASLQLSNALINQETGVRGYAIGGQIDYLRPWTEGGREAQAALAQLHSITTIEEHAQVRELLAEVERATELWQRQYALPTIAAVGRDGPTSRDKPDPDLGRRLFDDVRSAMNAEQREMTAVRNAGRSQLTSAANFADRDLRRDRAADRARHHRRRRLAAGVVSRPLRGVGRQVRRTARGDFDHEITGDGPRDIVELGADVDTMRRRIVEELASIQEAHRQLDQQTRELQRSNTELEQFAYVASHDLQEPLRKVASFCQLLEKRYKGQLDERGDQYIEFAVDGAKRMQQLINDLLAFSRVGRVTTELEVIDLDDVLRHALTSLAAAIEESDAEIAVPSRCRACAARRRCWPASSRTSSATRSSSAPETIARRSRSRSRASATTGSSPSPTTASGSSPTTPSGSS